MIKFMVVIGLVLGIQGCGTDWLKVDPDPKAYEFAESCLEKTREALVTMPLNATSADYAVAQMASVARAAVSHRAKECASPIIAQKQLEGESLKTKGRIIDAVAGPATAVVRVTGGYFDMKALSDLVGSGGNVSTVSTNVNNTAAVTGEGNYTIPVTDVGALGALTAELPELPEPPSTSQ